MADPLRTTAPIGRRGLLRLGVAVIAIYPVKLFVNLLGYERDNRESEPRRVTMDLPEGVSFHGGVIAIKSNSAVHFLSSTCTHLGCQINRVLDNQLICPCHGSRFSTEGDVLDGPAKDSLRRLKYDVDGSQRQYVVYL